jgi:NADH-quinone oxidoreductase subunit E
LRPEAMSEIADLVGVTAAEVRGTATFYDMLHTEPVGTYVVSVCTNIACLLGGAQELLEHAESALGVRAGGTSPDGVFTLEEAECLADCDRTPCVQVNHRYVGGQTAESFDQLVADLRSGALAETVPPHGTLVRVRRSVGLEVDGETIASERAAMAAAQATRAAEGAKAKEADEAKAADTPAAKAPEAAKAAADSPAAAEATAKAPDAATVSGPPPSTTSPPAPTSPTPSPRKPSGGPA